ncbi:hypothetical protein C8R47DRAFT_714054 [Mycena vitilis]|nr:hypothetical protein C8R47DRAFT_714054 [Mycena vitilis]
MPTTLHPYPYSGPSASRSSQDIGTMLVQDSYLLHNISAQDLRARSPSLRTRPPSPRTRSPSPVQSTVDLPRSSENVAMLSSQLGLSEADPDGRLDPGIPEVVQFGRYERPVPIAKEPTQYIISPRTTTPLPSQLPEGWTACLHPEGVRYFCLQDLTARNYLSNSNCCAKRIFTDSDILKPELLNVIMDAMRTIADFSRSQNIDYTAVDLVLDVAIEDEKIRCTYYFVDHKTRRIFWEDKVDSNLFPVTNGLHGITSESHMHIRHELEAQYWLHCHLFPTSLEMTHEVVDEFRDIVNYYLLDLIISPTSTVPWKIEQLTHMLALAESFSRSFGSKFSGSACSLGLLMHTFVRDRVYNHHGEPSVRLNSDQSIYTPEQPTKFVNIVTNLVKFIMSPLLFYAPDFHLVALNTIYTDGLVRHRSWAEFVMRLSTEWQEVAGYATIVLNANVSFLSIQSVDQGGGIVSNRSPAQIASYLSIACSVGSIILGLLLLKQVRNRDRNTPTEAANFMLNHSHPSLGHIKLAILYALPYAMLIWSMLLFFVAFSFMCFQQSSTVTRLLVAVLCTAIAAIILWCIFTGWEGVFEAQESAGEEETLAESEGKDFTPSPVKQRWQWPPVFRKGSADSDRTIV